MVPGTRCQRYATSAIEQFPECTLSTALRQTSRLQTVFTKLGQQGIDVTKALADLATGNIKAAMQDLMAINKDHPGLVPGFPAQHAFNSTQMTATLQSGITKLSGQGVDVSEVQADLASGNTTAALQWMAEYHKAHPVQNVNTTASHHGNSTQWQKGGSFTPMTHPGLRQPDHATPKVPGQVQGST